MNQLELIRSEIFTKDVSLFLEGAIVVPHMNFEIRR